MPPALAAGCTIVLKPSQIAPLSAFALAEVLDEVRFPPGVFNLVTGIGSVVGEAIPSHPKIDMASFTGSTRAGKCVMTLAAETVKKVALELGGKSANIILEDADLDTAILARNVRVLLELRPDLFRSHSNACTPLAEVKKKAKAAAGGFARGNSLVPTTSLGPLASAVQRERVHGYSEKGISERAKLITGGVDAPDGLDKGFRASDRLLRGDHQRDDRPGGDLRTGSAILPYDTEEEAIKIANDSIYGLSGGVWSSDTAHAENVAWRIRTGQVDINGAFNPVAPFGGYKQSGVGREHGKFGL